VQANLYDLQRQAKLRSTPGTPPVWSLFQSSAKHSSVGVSVNEPLSAEQDEFDTKIIQFLQTHPNSTAIEVSFAPDVRVCLRIHHIHLQYICAPCVMQFEFSYISLDFL